MHRWFYLLVTVHLFIPSCTSKKAKQKISHVTWSGASSAYQGHKLGTNQIGMMRYAKHVISINEDCRSPRNIARRDLYLKLRAQILAGHQDCNVSSDCHFDESYEGAFISRLDQTKSVRECLSVVARKVLPACNEPKTVNPVEPVPHSFACIKKRCSPKFEGPIEPWKTRWMTYFQKQEDKYKDPIQKPLCKNLMDNPMNNFIDPQLVDYE